MAKAGAIRAGRAFVELFADDSKLVRGLRAAQAKLKAFGAAVNAIGMKLMGLGAMLTAPLLLAARTFDKMGSEMADASARLGMTTEALSGLAFIAELGGSSMEELENGIRKMQRTLVDAASGAQSAQDALRLVGLTVEDLDGLSPDKQFKRIAESLSKIEDPTVRAAAAMDIFGKSGTKLLPMMAQGVKGIEMAEEEAKRLGLIMSGEDAKAADTFGDTLGILIKSIKMAAFHIGASLAPTLIQMSEWLTKVIAGVSEWIKANRGLVLAALQVGVAIIAAGAAIAAVGWVLSSLGAIVGVAATAVTAFGTVLTTVGAILGAILTPIGIVIGAIAALGAYFLYSSGAAGEALTFVSDSLMSLANDAKTAFGAIGKALARGDIGKAAEVLWLTLKMWWSRGTGWISEIWENGLLWFKEKFYEAWAGIKMIFFTIGYGIVVAWTHITTAISNAWQTMCTGVRHAWDWTGKSLTETWNKLRGTFDKNFNADTANALVEENYQSAKNKMWDEAKAQMSAREQERDRILAQEEASYSNGIRAIIDETEAAKVAAREQRDAKIKANQEAVDKARADWQKSIDEVNAQSGPEGSMPGNGPKDPLEFLKNAKFALADMEDLLGGPRDTTRGTFNASAIQSLAGAGSAADRTAVATEQTAKHTKAIAGRMTSGQVFA